MEQRTFDELISHFNSTVSKWEIDLKYKFELLGMIADIGYEHKKMLNNLSSAEPLIYCKDCIRHNVSVQDWYDNHELKVCPLVEHRGKAQGHEFDYQFCVYADRKEDE